jgi:hypothetical protein
MKEKMVASLTSSHAFFERNGGKTSLLHELHHLPFEQFIAIELKGTFDGTSANFCVMSFSTLEKTKLTSFVAFE